MRYIVLILICFSLSTSSGFGMNKEFKKLPDDGLNIIPRPLMMKRNPGAFHFNSATVLLTPKGATETERQTYLRSVNLLSGSGIQISQNANSNFVKLIIDSSKAPNPEGYSLLVNSEQILITGHDAAGLFYGLQSLIQLAAVGEAKSIPACAIEDHPRFAYRGLHLDVCRHFFSADVIKKWIDVIALYKINTFHWHLTDDQGWRIEIKAFPELQSISAYRNETLIGHKKELPHVFDGKRYGGYYTQEEVKQIVQYASDRHINIIPEIEMPGHALAALAAYPNLGCTGGPYQTATFWGIFSDVYCAGNDSTFIFLQQVLDEVITLFPSKYIHIGGDECPKIRWLECPKCRKRMAVENLKDANELQSYFIQRMEKYLNSKGRQIIGWDEILEGGLSPGATVMSWTGEHGGIEAAKMHHTVIMTPEKYVYLDYYQSLYASEPLAGGGYLPLKKMYDYEPIPPVLTDAEAKYIIGVQTNTWSEYLVDEKIAEYMMFPRVMALSEIAWSSKNNRDYTDFLKRLRLQSALFKKLDIHAAEVYDEITYEAGKGADGKTVIGLFTTLPVSEIRYTTDGSAPAKNSTLYQNKLLIGKAETIHAAVFKNGKSYGRVFEKSFLFHKAIGKQVTLRNKPADNFNPGEAALVNGIEASNLYNDGQWLGFSGVDLEAVIDLGSMQTISIIGTNILKYHWQRMWEPTELRFEISEDGVQYKTVFSQTDFPVNGINTIRAEFKNKKARYIKVIAINKGIIPPGEYGEGAKAQLLMDEAFVY